MPAWGGTAAEPHKAAQGALPLAAGSWTGGYRASSYL